VSLSNYLKPSISSSVNCGHVAANRSDGRAAEFVNIGRNVVVASKSEGWCALSPIVGTGSRDEYITNTKVEENSHNPAARRKHVVDVYYMYRLAATRTPQFIARY